MDQILLHRNGKPVVNPFIKLHKNVVIEIAELN
jgi:hypothetical protein